MSIITLVRGDDTDYDNQVLIDVSFITELNLDNYKARLTIINPTNVVTEYTITDKSFNINLNKITTSTLEVGTHNCNIKLINPNGKIKTVYNFNVNVLDGYSELPKYTNEYKIEIKLEEKTN